MEKAIVATAQVSDSSALKEKIEKLQFGEPSYYLLQCPHRIADWQTGMPDSVEIDIYIQGRIFGTDGELRWQKTEGSYTLIWLSEGELPDGFAALGDWETGKPQDIYLLGGGDSPEWRDTRIPRKLVYPIEKSQYPCVKAIQYKESNSHTIRFTRYIEFIAKKGA